MMESPKAVKALKFFSILLPLLTVAAIAVCIGLYQGVNQVPDARLRLYEGPQSLRQATPEDLISGNEDEKSLTLLRSGDTQLRVNGAKCFVYETTVNNTHSWAANYLPKLSKTPIAYFDFSGRADLEVSVAAVPLESAAVSFDGGEVKFKLDEASGTVRFSITEPGSYTVQFNGSPERAFHIFANPYEETIPTESTPDLVYIGPGEWNTDRIQLEDSQTLYLAGGAVVHGTLYAESAKDIKILGPGILDGSLQASWKGTSARVPIDLRDCENVTVSGPILLNANAWNLNGFQLKNARINQVKIISARPNGDGITLQSCKDVTVENSFVRSWDDSLVLKNYGVSTENITFSKMTLWTDLAQSMEIGYETNKGQIPDAYIKNILFENIYVLHAFHKPVISVHNADDATISDVTFRNITVEDARMGLGDAGQNNQLIDLHITRNGSWSTSKERGQIRNIMIENVVVQGGVAAPSRLQGWDEDHTIENVTIKNLRILGKKITSLAQGNFEISDLSVKNVTLE